MYFRFCGWRRVSYNAENGPNQRLHECFVQFARLQHRGRSLPFRTASCFHDVARAFGLEVPRGRMRARTHFRHATWANRRCRLFGRYIEQEWYGRTARRGRTCGSAWWRRSAAVECRASCRASHSRNAYNTRSANSCENSPSSSRNASRSVRSSCCTRPSVTSSVQSSSDAGYFRCCEPAKYCDQRCCVFVCLSVCPLPCMKEPHVLRFYQTFSTYLWPCSVLIYAMYFQFVDDVMFPYNGGNRPSRIKDKF